MHRHRLRPAACSSKLRALLLPQGATAAAPAASVPLVLVDRLALLAATAAALGGLPTAEQHLVLAQELAAVSRRALGSSSEAERVSPTWAGPG